MVFSENTDTYTLETTPLSSTPELFSGLWLVIAGTDRIPPHIALLYEGKYYSHAVKKVDTGTPLEFFLKAISRRPAPTLFVKFKDPVPTDSGTLKDIFSIQNSKFKIENYTCLTPISRFFAERYSTKYGKPNLVFELLALAEQDDIIESCRALFVVFPIQNSKFTTLPKYTLDHVKEKINSYSN